MTTCVVFTCNETYFDKFLSTCSQLIKTGYKDNICLVIGNDINNNEALLDHEFIIKNSIIVKYFPDIVFTEEALKQQFSMSREAHWPKKLFQYHKLHLFNVYFKRWSYIFYIDCGVTILNDISPIINSKQQNRLLAHSDAYPNYEWHLHRQFDANNVKFTQLFAKYNLNIDYFQTTVMLYDTSIIEKDTFDNLYNLFLEWPISITNDQGIIALYFTNIKPLWSQIPVSNESTNFYDYLRRNSNPYIILKLV